MADLANYQKTSAQKEQEWLEKQKDLTNKLTHAQRKTATWVGCAVDSVSSRVLSEATKDSAHMTHSMCQEHCKAYPYYGVEGGRRCFCGKMLKDETRLVYRAECSSARCAGDSKVVCGGNLRTSIFVMR